MEKSRHGQIVWMRKLEQLVKRMTFFNQSGAERMQCLQVYPYRLIVQQNCEDGQVITLARGHARVRFTIHAHAATCVPRSL